MSAKNMFTSYFYEVSDEQWQSWIDDLASEWNVKMLTDGEMCRVVKHMVGGKDCPRRPTLRDLLQGIRSYRKYADSIRKDFESPETYSCAICHGSGLMQFHGLANEGGNLVFSSIRVDDGGEYHANATCPCKCAKGQDKQRQQNANADWQVRLQSKVFDLYRAMLKIPAAVESDI